MTVNLYLNDVLKDTRTVTLSQQGDSVTLTWPGLHSVTISLANVTTPTSPATGRIDEYKLTQVKDAQGVVQRNTRTAVRTERRVTAYYTDWDAHQTSSDRVDFPGSPFITSYGYRDGNTWTEGNYRDPNYYVSWSGGNYADFLYETSTVINIQLRRQNFTYLPIRNRANTGLVRGNTIQLVLRDGDA